MKASATTTCNSFSTIRVRADRGGGLGGRGDRRVRAQVKVIGRRLEEYDEDGDGNWQVDKVNRPREL